MIKTSGRHLAMLIVALGIQCVALAAGPGRITVNGTQFQLAGKPIYFNGANTPWNGWDDFGSVDWRNYNRSWWEAEFARMKAKGINSTRVWISCSGDAMPYIDSNGYVTGVSQRFWNDVDHYMGLASKYEIYVLPTMMSFDHTKVWNANHARWRLMFSSQDRVQAMIDNYIIPFVLRYKNNPYFYAVDLCNEPEWINEIGDNGNLPVWQLQRYAAMSAAAIHRSGSEVLVSIGSAGIKWNSDRYNGNYWSDAALQAQYPDSQAFMDFYHIHYYKWMEPWFPLLRSPADNGIDDRPVIYGEMPGRDDSDVFPTGLTMTQAFESFLSSGYDGHYPWTSNGVDGYGNLTSFGADTLAFRQAHPDLCDPLADHLVVYNGNEATGGATPEAQIKSSGTTITLAVNSGSLVKAGYTFAGWNTEMDGSGTTYAAGAAYSGNANLTLFAMWTTGTPTYTVAYNANGAATGTVPANQTKTQGVSLKLADNAGNLAKSGFSFAGWNTAAAGNGVDYAEGATYSQDADLTLYAKWAPLPIVSVGLPAGISTYGYTGENSINALTAFQSLINQNQLSLVRAIDPATGGIKELYYTTFPTPNWVNEIGDLTLGRGYIVKTKVACNLAIPGNKSTGNVSHSLPKGYSIVAFNKEAPMNAVTAFQSLIDSGALELVRWVDPTSGAIKELYFTSYPSPSWVNEIGDLTEGQGYIIKLRSAQNGFQFP